MAGEERLRLIAEFRDNASAGVRRLSRELGEVRQTPGMANAKKWMDESTTRAEGFQRGGAGVGVVMSGLGISGLAAGAGIASAVAAFRDLANRAVDLKETARLTGLTTVQIQQLDRAAKDLNVDPNQLNAGLKGWAERMEEFKRHLGDLYGELNQIDPGFARKLSFEAPLDQVKDIFHWLSKVQDPQLQRKWTELFFGTGDLSQMLADGWNGFNKALDHAVATTATMSADQIRQAQTLKNSVNDLDGAMDKFQTEAGPFIFKQLTEATKDFTELFKEVEGTVEWFQKNKDHPVKALADAAEGAIDRQAEENRKHPDGIILDVPGLASRFEHWINGDKPADATAASPATVPPLVTPSNPVDHSALDRLRGAMQGGGQAPIVLPNSLLHRSSYIEGEDDQPSRGGSGGMDMNLVMLFRETIASGTKAGYLAAVRELQGEVAGGAGGGFQNASYGGEGVGGGSFGGGAGGRRAPSLRYGRQHSTAPFMDAGGGADGAAVHDSLKDLISQHETGTTGAGGYDTAYGHAEQPGSKMHALAPPKPLTQMTIAEVLAYQREMKPRAHSSAFPVGRAQWTETTLRGLTRGMDPSTVFSPEVQEKLFDKSIAQRMGQGVGGFRSEWDSLNHVDAGTIQGAISGHRTGVGFSGGASGVTGKTTGVNPVMLDLVKRASEILGAPLSVYSGRRSPEHNAAVGGAEHSLHMQGFATDLTTPGHPKTDRAFWERANGAMRQAAQEYHQPYRWGGEFGGKYARDNDHFDLTKNGSSAEALAKHMSDLEGKQHQLETHQTKTLSTAHRLLGWADRATSSRLMPHTSEEPLRSLFDAANKSGIGGSMTHKIEGGATVEIRGLPDHKGVKTKTSGMIEAVNLRRGGPMTTQVG